HYLRGRASGEIIALFRQGLRDGRRVAETYELRGSLLAVESALEMAQPGELLLLQADVVDETVDFVRNYIAALPPRALSAELESAPWTATAVPVLI
ncbi:MAG: hypothetical protein K1X74_21065, partial [Pirellulales bacterium]|nr:hypothetical protein [Pirellulales bacterium]